MTPLWRKRIGWTAGIWLVLVLIAWWLQMDPAVTVLAGYVAGACALTWLTADVAQVTQPAHWAGSYSPAPRPRGADPRLSHLHRLVHDAIDRDAREHRRRRPPVALQELLAGLADERLESAHGLRLDSDGAEVRARLGPELTDYLHRSPEELRVLTRAQLSDHLTRIEAL